MRGACAHFVIGAAAGGGPGEGGRAHSGGRGASSPGRDHAGGGCGDHAVDDGSACGDAGGARRSVSSRAGGPGSLSQPVLQAASPRESPAQDTASSPQAAGSHRLANRSSGVTDSRRGGAGSEAESVPGSLVSTAASAAAVLMDIVPALIGRRRGGDGLVAGPVAGHGGLYSPHGSAGTLRSSGSGRWAGVAAPPALPTGDSAVAVAAHNVWGGGSGGGSGRGGFGDSGPAGGGSAGDKASLKAAGVFAGLYWGDDEEGGWGEAVAGMLDSESPGEAHQWAIVMAPAFAKPSALTARALEWGVARPRDSDAAASPERPSSPSEAQQPPPDSPSAEPPAEAGIQAPAGPAPDGGATATRPAAHPGLAAGAATAAIGHAPGGSGATAAPITPPAAPAAAAAACRGVAAWARRLGVTALPDPSAASPTADGDADDAARTGGDLAQLSLPVEWAERRLQSPSGRAALIEALNAQRGAGARCVSAEGLRWIAALCLGLLDALGAGRDAAAGSAAAPAAFRASASETDAQGAAGGGGSELDRSADSSATAAAEASAASAVGGRTEHAPLARPAPADCSGSAGVLEHADQIVLAGLTFWSAAPEASGAAGPAEPFGGGRRARTWMASLMLEHSAWQSPPFWEAALVESTAAALRRVADGGGVGEQAGRSWARMSDAERRGVKAQEEAALAGQLGSFAVAMQSYGAPKRLGGRLLAGFGEAVRGEEARAALEEGVAGWLGEGWLRNSKRADDGLGGSS
uniref:Uncharacterized protein n=1 Tax=Cafeteria roenbergensis TaxID=33653 RepID=A0A7S0JXF0_CAFRO